MKCPVMTILKGNRVEDTADFWPRYASHFNVVCVYEKSFLLLLFLLAHYHFRSPTQQPSAGKDSLVLQYMAITVQRCSS